MAFKPAKNQPPQRHPELLVTDTDEAGAIPYDKAAPGLYPGEVMVELDDGKFVAVSVEVEWLEGFGVAFKGCARWCDKEGATRTTVDGKHAEVTFPLSVDTPAVNRHGPDTFKREVLLALLGEQPQAFHEETCEDGAQIPVVSIDEGARQRISIREAVKCVESVLHDSGVAGVVGDQSANLRGG